MKKLWLVASVLSVFFFLGMAAQALAAPVLFFGEDINHSNTVRKTPHLNSDAARANFLSNLSGVGTENFESFAPGASNLALTFQGAGTATLNGLGDVVRITTGTNGFGRYPISGNQYYEVDTSNFNITFSDPIAAFGFYGVDIGDFGGQLKLTLTNGTSISLTVPNTIGSSGSTDGSVLYFGFYDLVNQYTKITFTNTNIQDVFAYDDMTIGSLQQVIPNPVPEPGTMMLLGSGLMGLAAWRRKK